MLLRLSADKMWTGSLIFLVSSIFSILLSIGFDEQRNYQLKNNNRLSILPSWTRSNTDPSFLPSNTRDIRNGRNRLSFPVRLPNKTTEADKYFQFHSKQYIKVKQRPSALLNCNTFYPIYIQFHAAVSLLSQERFWESKSFLPSVVIRETKTWVQRCRPFPCRWGEAIWIT